MATRNQIRTQYARWHRQYEKQAYRELQKTFKRWGNNIPYDLLTEENYESLIKLAIMNGEMEQTYVRIYTGIGLEHGKRVGKSINRQLKFFEPNSFESAFIATIRRYIRLNLGDRIVSVESTYFKTIANILATRLDEGKTMQQASKELQEAVGKRNFYRYQAERIARTETTTAANYAAIQAEETTIYKMEKVWISALDTRTRTTPPDEYDHRRLNGQTTTQKGSFTTSKGEQMQYPGDPSASAGNTINCRCSVSLRPVRDKDGNLIEK